MTTTAINRSQSKRKPASRDILGYKWIDSAFTRMTSFEATVANVQNQIDSSNADEATKNRQFAYLKKIINDYQAFLPVTQDDPAPETGFYTPSQIWDHLKNPETGRLYPRKKIKAFLDGVHLDSLYAFILNAQTFGHTAKLAAGVWLNKVELEHITYKEANYPSHLYDARALSPVILNLFKKHPEHPLSVWVAGHPGYRHAYQEVHDKTQGIPSEARLSYKAAWYCLSSPDWEQWAVVSRSQYLCMIIREYTPQEHQQGLQAYIVKRMPEFTMNLAPVQEAETPLQRTISDVMRRSQFHVKVDPHMLRAAEIIGKLSPSWSETALMRLYFIIRHIDMNRRNEPGQDALNYVTLKELRTFLKAAGLYTKQSFKRWIDDGVEAGYWTHAHAEKRVHYRGLKAIAAMVMKCLPDDVIADFRGNQALGGRMVWVDVRGKLGKFKGRVLGAWLEQRVKDENGLTIQNQTIAAMWNVSVRCVQNWRKQAEIPHTVNYTETKSKTLPIRRIPNTYFSPDDTREHSHAGQSRKVRQIAKRELTKRGFSPDSYGDVGEAKQHRLTFTDSENMTAIEALWRYRDKHGKPHGQSQHARTTLQTVKTGVIALHVEVI